MYWNAPLSFAQSVMLWVVLLAGLVAVLALVFYLRDREGFDRFWKSVSPRLTALGIGTITLLLLVVEVLLQNFSIEWWRSAEGSRRASPYTSGVEAPVGTRTTLGPVASVFAPADLHPRVCASCPVSTSAGKRRHTTATKPPSLSPGTYLRQAAKALEGFTVRRVGEEWVMTRKVTMLEEVPITMERAEISARFQIRQCERKALLSLRL